MLLLVLAGLGVLVTENEVNLKKIELLVPVAVTCTKQRLARSYLVGGTTLVGTEHDHVGRRVRELVEVELLVVLEKLQVGTTADKGV